jgi:hypothetical protein
MLDGGYVFGGFQIKYANVPYPPSDGDWEPTTCVVTTNITAVVLAFIIIIFLFFYKTGLSFYTVLDK